MTYLLLLLQKMYPQKTVRHILHSAWSCISILTLFLFSVKNKNFMYHIGLFGKNMNTGDVLLYHRLERVFDAAAGIKNRWYHRLAFGEITRPEIFLVNKYAKAIIVGGHGLLMPDSNKNNNSGWGFNIKIENLEKITIPLVFFAVGYNVFPGEDKFIPVFRKHLAKCVEKSLFFGLRNYGSINAVREYLPRRLHDKIRYQPCVTTMTAVYPTETAVSEIKGINTAGQALHPPPTAASAASRGVLNPSFPHSLDHARTSTVAISFRSSIKPENEIAIAVAFNHFENRFGADYRTLFEQLIKYCRTMEQKGFKIILCGHHVADTHNKHIPYFKRRGFSVKPLYKYSENAVYAFYKSKKLVVGMRGHGLMIPFGLDVPVLSLTTQDKQKWFIETTGHGEWNIALTNNLYHDLLHGTLKIVDNYASTKNEIMEIQKRNREITDRNIHAINRKILRLIGET